MVRPLRVRHPPYFDGGQGRRERNSVVHGQRLHPRRRRPPLHPPSQQSGVRVGDLRRSHRTTSHPLHPVDTHLGRQRHPRRDYGLRAASCPSVTAGRNRPTWTSSSTTEHVHGVADSRRALVAAGMLYYPLVGVLASTRPTGCGCEAATWTSTSPSNPKPTSPPAGTPSELPTPPSLPPQQATNASRTCRCARSGR